MKFRTTVILGGKNATGMQIPDDVVAALGSTKRPAVQVTINGHTYRSTVAVMGGVFMLPISAEIRSITGVAAGDDIEAELELDTAPREVVVPPDLAAALAADPIAQAAFDRLSYSNKRQHTLAVEGAKAAETRQRRITKAVETLRAGTS